MAGIHVPIFSFSVKFTFSLSIVRGTLSVYMKTVTLDGTEWKVLK